MDENEKIKREMEAGELRGEVFEKHVRLITKYLILQ